MNNNPKNLKIIPIILLLTLLISLAVLSIVFMKDSEKGHTGCDLSDEEYETLFDQKIGLLKRKIYSDNDVRAFEGVYAVFISVSNSIDQARVFAGTASTLIDAWNEAETSLRTFVSEKNYAAVWLKAEALSHASHTSAEELSKSYAKNYNLMYRKSLAFDGNFENFILEAELLSNNIIDVENKILVIDSLNDYFESSGRSTRIREYPKSFISFTCDGYFADEHGEIHELYTDSLNYGRRLSDTPSAEHTLEMVSSASSFLVDLLDEKGRFIYGYYPTSNSEIENYNILRHAGTIWSMICQYKINGNEDLPDKIRLAINYMLSKYTGKNGGFYTEMDDDTVYIVERKSAEIKLGGNAIAIVALTEYINEFGQDDPYFELYSDTVRKLANGILKMQNYDGSYYHVWHVNFTEKAEYRTVYYDGEATFALARTYSLTKDQKYLDAAEKAVNMFIREDYTQYRDHWVAYALNEVTMYSPEEKYFNFALENASKSLDVIYNQKTAYHTYMELLMSTFDLYDRIVQSGISVSGLSNFEINDLIDTIYKRANYMLNSYTYPELIMYMKNPQQIMGAFFVRHDEFRVRIDDVQHFVGGYYKYYINYDKLLYYRFPGYYPYPTK